MKLNDMHFRILVVEDEKDIVSLYKLYFQDAGYFFDHAYCALDALIAIQEKKYDMIILDLYLPDSIGFNVYDEIRKIDKKIKIILATAKYLFFHEFRKFDICGYFEKPFNVDNMIDKIRKIEKEEQN